MSIQQSVNQAISGSLFLLNQTDAFQRLKAIRDAKRDAETQSEINRIVGKPDNTSVDASQNVTGEQGTAEQVGANTAEGTQKNNVDERAEFARKQGSMLADMFMKLQKSILEAKQAKEKSEEFRKMVLQGVYVKGDKWDGK